MQRSEWRRTLGGTRRSTPIAALFWMLAAPAVQAEPGASTAPGGFWGDFGVGYASVDTASAPYGDSSGGVLIDVTAGLRLGPRWRVGLNVGGAGSQIGNNNCDSQQYCNSVYGQSLTNVFVALEFEPGVDHGWLFGVSGGEVLYHNRRLEELGGDTRSGNGTGFLARVGYDWPCSGRLHLSAQLSAEKARISLNDPFAGRFSSSVVGVSIHAAYY